jgi:hypothetical protein
MALGACSFYLAETADLRLGASISLGQQYENFPRVASMIQPSWQWWRRTRKSEHNEILQHDKGPAKKWGWNGIPTFGF